MAVMHIIFLEHSVIHDYAIHQLLPYIVQSIKYLLTVMVTVKPVNVYETIVAIMREILKLL